MGGGETDRINFIIVALMTVAVRRGS